MDGSLPLNESMEILTASKFKRKLGQFQRCLVLKLDLHYVNTDWCRLNSKPASTLTLQPFISNELQWTLTNLIYNAFNFIMFHGISGTPFIGIRTTLTLKIKTNIKVSLSN